MQSLLLGALVLLMKVVPVYLRPYLPPCSCDAEREMSICAMCVLVILPKHLTSKCPVGTSCRSHHFAIYLRSTSLLFRSFQYPQCVFFCFVMVYLPLSVTPCSDH